MYTVSFEVFFGIVIMLGLFLLVEILVINYFILNYFNYNTSEYIKKRIVYADSNPQVSIYCYNQTDDFCKNIKS